MHAWTGAAVCGLLASLSPVPRDFYRSPTQPMSPNNVPQLVDLLCGSDENAYHTLMEADDDIVPLLMEHYAAVLDGEHRARIIEVIWQHRLSTTIPFLATALNDEHPDVWKRALDGLVTIGGNESRRVLKECLARIVSDDERSIWIAEAIDQIKL